MYEARSIFVMKNMRVRDLEIFIDYANLDNLVIAFFNWILCHHLINYRCSLFIVINLWSRVKGQSYIITGLKFLDESLPASSATLYSYPQYKTLLTLMNGQQLIPIRFFFVVNEAGRRTMRGQRARIVAATDRGIDLTLERNAYSLLAGCYFA